MASPVPPSVLAERYEILRELGRGGMATVYLARDLQRGGEVAVKILSPGLRRAWSIPACCSRNRPRPMPRWPLAIPRPPLFSSRRCSVSPSLSRNRSTGTSRSPVPASLRLRAEAAAALGDRSLAEADRSRLAALPSRPEVSSVVQLISVVGLDRRARPLLY